MGRAPCCDKSKVKRGPWSPDEDETLKTFIRQNGTGGNWIALPAKAGLKRCGKSCRLRWLNYLRPDIKHGGFTEEEDNVICTFYTTIGSRWSIIASQLQGRTDNDVKNYWNTKLKKKFFAGKIDIIANNNNSTSSNDLLPQIWSSNNPGDSQHCFNSESANSNSIPSLVETGDNFCNYSQQDKPNPNYIPSRLEIGDNFCNYSQQDNLKCNSNPSLMGVGDNLCNYSVQDLFVDHTHQFQSPVPTAAEAGYGYSSLTVPFEDNDDGIPAYFGFESALNYNEQFNDVGFQEIKICHYQY